MSNSLHNFLFSIVISYRLHGNVVSCAECLRARGETTKPIAPRTYQAKTKWAIWEIRVPFRVLVISLPYYVGFLERDSNLQNYQYLACNPTLRCSGVRTVVVVLVVVVLVVCGGMTSFKRWICFVCTTAPAFSISGLGFSVVG